MGLLKTALNVILENLCVKCAKWELVGIARQGFVRVALVRVQVVEEKYAKTVYNNHEYWLVGY